MSAAAVRKKKKKTLAEKADKFVCYQKSVQCPEHEVEFFQQAFKEAYRRKPQALREDFCGTFAICCDWVVAGEKRTAVGVDLCGETLRWGRDHNLSKLKPAEQSRVTILEQDVRTASEQKFDVLAAQNFSFWIFKTRDAVREYFEVAYSNLNDQGIMVMDMMGGGACYEEGNVDKRTIRKGKNGFDYHWKQVSFNPVTADATFAISFKFADGSRLRNAFEYDWRFWTIPEVRELAAEAGFRETHVYWEQEDEDGEDTGEWKRDEVVSSNASWIAYIVAVK